MRRIIPAVCAVCLLLVLWHGREETVTVSAPEQEYTELSILMYHSILKDPKQQGDYVVSPDVLSSDLEWLIRNHYQTVSLREIIDYVNGSGTLPEKSVLITFDDGYYNNYLYAYPILQKYGARAVLSPVASLDEQFTESGEENASWSYCTEKELKEMSDSGVFEIANHSYDMHELSPRRGCLKRSGETERQYREALQSDITKAQQLFVEYGLPEPVCFTYPYGAMNDETEQIVREMGFSVTLGCEEGINVLIRGDPECLYRMKRYNRASGSSSEQFLSKVTGKAKR